MEEVRHLTPRKTTPGNAIAIAPAAQKGDGLADIDTPSLILDLDAFEHNLRTMQVLAERHGVALRPHAKAHRCPEIALRQLALGAQGICCQKVSEAVPFVAAGLRNIHISNEVVGPAKLTLLAQLAQQADITVCVDHPDNIQALSDALDRHKASLGVLVEIDVGQKRCGVQTPDETVALARRIQSLPHIRFAGIQAYHGGLQHKRSLEQRQHSCEKAARLIRKHLHALDQAGIPCPVVTGGGTGSAVFDVASQVFTEIQAGTYAFMDADYGGLDWGDAPIFQHSLFLLSTVMSTPTFQRAVLDAGLKSTSAESGVPRIADREGVVCLAVNDEHSILQADSPACRPALGERIRLIPSHCDPTFNLHDSVVAVRSGRVEAIWSIAARGLSR
ncbi:MAG: DSD1 family PLP-dependent enzyme [Pusillimonas sp.]